MFKQTHTGGRVIKTKTTNAPEGDSGVTTESGKKASCKKLPLRKVVIIWIVVCGMVTIDAVLFYHMVYTPVIDLNNSSHDSFYDSFPEYSGVVEEILARGIEVQTNNGETYDVIAVIYAGVADNNSDDYADVKEIKFESVSSVEVGQSCSYISPKEAIIKVSGENGEKWFFANTQSHVYDSIADERGLANIEVGKNITIAYSSKDGIDDYDYVYAVKGEVPQSRYLDVVRTYALSVCLPSVIIAVCAIFFLFWFTSDSVWEKPRVAAIIVSVIIVILIAIVCFGIDQYLKAAKAAASSITAHAPIIYLYNDNDELINVKLDLDGELTVTYPEYPTGEGWTVSAAPDGRLTDTQGQEYPFLFWEAELNMDYDLSKGFCVKGSDTEEFLDEVLPELGLNENEMEDFEAYWLPLMADNPYNVITFQTTAYTDAAKLDVTPEPDVVVRVNMLWYASDCYVDIEPQVLEDMNSSLEDRDGFVLVEWGGEIIEQ